MADEAETGEDQEKTDEAPETDQESGLDLDAQQARLDEVEKQIEEGRRALADGEQETEPEPDGQPVAEDEGAANAPPG